MPNRPSPNRRVRSTDHTARHRRRAWLGGACPAALAAAGGLVSPARPAVAGVTLVSRHSVIQSSTGTAVDDAARADTFDRFADQVGTGETAVNGVLSVAQQYTAPGLLGASGAGLEGAFGEGQVRSEVTADAGRDARSTSGFAVTFVVEGGPATYAIGAAVGAAGGGSVSIDLVAVGGPRAADPVFGVRLAADDTAGHDDVSRELAKEGVLAPGRYRLDVAADSVDQTPADGESSAYYNFNLTLGAPSGGGGTQPPAAVPLPPAALAGGGMLGLLAGGRALRRRRAA